MTTPGFFELYPSARPALPAGAYTATGSQQVIAQTPHDGPATVPIDDTAFHLVVDAPRYKLPPDQILSTFPPAGTEGDWRERLPQIVIKRRTLPWERNPAPGSPAGQQPPWLALVVLADGEGTLSPDVDPSRCVSAGIDLGPEADVPKAKYLEVGQDIVDKVFPCRDELDLLCHVRKVDLRDTELALGDDDGFLAVVLSSRLPQPAAPASAGAEAKPLKYTAYLINLERQLDVLLPTEPAPSHSFNATLTTDLIDQQLLAPAPDATIDQIAMTLGPALQIQGKGVAKAVESGSLVPFSTAQGIESKAGAWAIGPVVNGVAGSADFQTASAYKAGVNAGFAEVLVRKLRFPVLVSWEFTCTGEGGFERLMNNLDVGLLGTVDETTAPPNLEVAATGHISLAHRTRRGEASRSWYRGPLTPQPTVRAEAVQGVLPLAHTGDQLRKVVPDGREDISLAALFEIGRLLTLNKPTLVAQLMQWRRELFGAARARELADALASSVVTGLGLGAASGRNALEDLVRTVVVDAFVTLPADALGPPAPAVTAARMPAELLQLQTSDVLTGLGLDADRLMAITKAYGVDGLATVPLQAQEAPTIPAAGDKASLLALNNTLGLRVDDLVMSALKATEAPPHGQKPRRGRKKDTLDRLIGEAAARARINGPED
ncbi:hypothetical protein OG809_34060 [Kribbella soli]